VIIRRTGAGALLALMTAWACTDATPTSQDPDLIPIEAETYEVFLPFSAFGADFETFRGFGSVTALGAPLLANEWTAGDPDDGTLEARPLIRFGFLPDSILVVPPDGGDAQVDTDFVPVSGRLTIFFDTAGLNVDDMAPVTVMAGATEANWDRASATWEMAVDTVGGQLAWPEPGGGPVRPLGSATWTPLDTDSISFDVDSLSVTEWVSPDADHGGLLLSSDAANLRVRVREAALRVDVRPSINPDTLIQIGPVTRQFTFLYDPTPEASPGTFLVGGAPSSRATFRFNLPEVLDGDAEICAFVPCPLELRSERVLFAALVLTTRSVTPGALRPRSPFNLAARVVLAPDRLPRSPLGRSVQAAPRELNPNVFGEAGGTSVEIPMTRYVQELVAALRNPDLTPPDHVAFLTPSEPLGLEMGAFAAPGSPGEPVLRLILTISEGVTLP